jgi:integral membrane protein
MRPVKPFLRTLRIAALVEAVSYLLLLGVAMPLKYVWGEPLAVRLIGMAHGVLFLWLLWLLQRARFEAGWPIRRVLLVFGASLVPLWPFFLDRSVRRWIESPPPPPPPATG